MIFIFLINDITPESQKVIDFRAAAFLAQNTTAKLLELQHFLIFETVSS